MDNNSANDNIGKQLQDYLDNNVSKTTTDGTEQYTYTGGSSIDPFSTGCVWMDDTVPPLTTTNTVPIQPSPYYTPGTYSTPGTYDGTTTDWTFSNPTDTLLENVVDRLEGIEKRLSIVDKAPDDKIKALEEAYAHYKFIEKLCEGEENDIGTEPE